jgi:hypothetical protein
LQPRKGTGWLRSGGSAALAGTGRWTAGSGVRGVGASEGAALPAPAGARKRPAGRTTVGNGRRALSTPAAPLTSRRRTGRRHRRCSSARGRVASINRWHACSPKDGSSAAVVRRAGKGHRGDRRSVRRPPGPSDTVHGPARVARGRTSRCPQRAHALGRRGASVDAWPGRRGRARHARNA